MKKVNLFGSRHMTDAISLNFGLCAFLKTLQFGREKNTEAQRIKVGRQWKGLLDCF